MAKIELVNVCKRLKGDDEPMLPSFRTVRNMQSGTLGNHRKRPFSIENMNLDIPDGKTMVILGPTGCGKTTLLRIIAGLIPVDSGEIRYGGVNMENTPPGERGIGMVFQNYALYPHFTSKSNILSYFLFKKKTPELDKIAREKYRRTAELMGVDMAYLLDKKPTHLSGGEKQRVALGRCITRDPALFLLDEPFSNLDQKLREKYRVNLKTLLKHFQITAVYVTHDQQEALILADLIAIMNVGRIEQVGTYENIYDNPKSTFVAEFLNLDIDTPAINLICGEDVAQELKDMIVGVRPEDIEVFEEKRGDCIIRSIVDIRNIPLRNTTILRTRIGRSEVYVQIPSKKSPPVSKKVWLGFRRYHIFDKNSGQRLRSSREN